MENYMLTVRRWLGLALPIPQKIMHISLCFLLFSLPVLTVGYAALVCTLLARLSADGREVPLREMIRAEARHTWHRAILMGWLDLAAVFLSFLCVGVLFGPGTTSGIRFLYGLLLLLDIIFLTSAIFRYPILAANGDLSLSELLLRSTVATFRHLPSHFLYMMVLLTLLGLCIFTGIGLLLVFPGAAAMFAVVIYRQTLQMENNQQMLSDKSLTGSIGNHEKTIRLTVSPVIGINSEKVEGDNP